MRPILKISFWLSLAELAFNFSGYIIHAFLGRFLGPADYGRFSLVIVFSTMVIILIGRGIPISMSKYLSEIYKTNKPEVKNIKRHAAWLQFLIIAVVSVLYFWSAPLFAKLLKDPTLAPLFRISTFIIPTFALASFYIYYFNGIHQFNRQSLLKFVRAGAKIIFILGFGYLYKTAGAIIGQALAPLSVFLVAYFLDPFRKLKNLSPAKKFDKNLFKKITCFAWPIITFMLFYELMISIDLYLVKAIMRSDYQAGLFNSALTVGRIPYYAFYFLTILLLPKISQSIARKDTKKTKKILSVSYRFLFMLMLPTLAILSYFSASALEFFYGAEFTLAAAPMSILVFGLGFLTVYYTITFVLNGAGKNKIPMYSSIVGAILNAILNYFFIKQWGLMGAAWATTITAFLIMLFSLIYTSRKITSFLKITSLIKYSLASFLIYLTAYQFFYQGKFIFILWSLILLALYLMVLFITKEFKKKDAEFLMKSFNKNNQKQ